MRAPRPGGQPQRHAGTTSRPRRNSAATCHPWRRDRRPPPPPPDRRRARHDAARTRLPPDWPARSSPPSAPCPSGPGSAGCPSRPPAGTTGSPPHGPPACPSHVRSSSRADRAPWAGRHPLHDAGSPPRGPVAPGWSPCGLATVQTQGRPADIRRRPSARTSDALHPGRVLSPGRRSGCSPAPPDRRRSRRRQPCVPSGDWSRNPARSHRPRRTACATRRRIGVCDQPVDCQRGEQRLRLDIASIGRALEPSRAIRPARRHACAFQIAAPYAVFRLGDPGARGTGAAAGRPASCRPVR